MDTSLSRARKRGRSDSLSSISSAASSSSTNSAASTSSALPLNKIQRASPTPENGDLECNLPPTCFPDSRSFGSPAELDRHQLAFHTYICRTPVRDKTDQVAARSSTGGGPSDAWGLPREFTSRKRNEWKECRKVFPDQRLLDLHQAETHDPVKRAQHKAGISIFQCFVPPPECTRLFINPKHRRMHLIDKHKYPKQYFFSITNHGLNRITENEGLGASLIRPKKDHRHYVEANIDPETMDKNEDQNRDQEKGAVGVDVEMEELTKGMSGLESSLSMVPVQLRRRAKKKTGGNRLESGIQ